jgi:hypothetical protein
VIWLHVDNGVVTASNSSLLLSLEKDLKHLLKIKWLHELTSIVGLKVSWSLAGFQLSQPNLIYPILEKHWDTGITSSTPLPANYHATTAEDGFTEDSGRYLSVIGSLSYLAVGTWPNICFAVNYLARFAAKPRPVHWNGVKHLINYLARSRQLQLNLFPQDNSTPLKCFADASWGGEFARSTYPWGFHHIHECPYPVDISPAVVGGGLHLPCGVYGFGDGYQANALGKASAEGGTEERFHWALFL